MLGQLYQGCSNWLCDSDACHEIDNIKSKVHAEQDLILTHACRGCSKFLVCHQGWIQEFEMGGGAKSYTLSQKGGLGGCL